MALVTCPECGRERVSDLAEICPECGFPIKSYYENKEKSESEKLNVIEEKDTNENNKSGEQEFTDYLIDTKEKYKPEKPTILSVAFDDVLYGVGGIVVFSIFAWVFHDISEFISTVFIFLVICYGIGYGISGVSHLSKAIEEYNEKLKRWEENPVNFFVQELNRCAEERTEEQKDMKADLSQSTQTTCPKCGSTSFTPVRRKWSFLTGFMTNKVDMVCNNCGYTVKTK